MPATKKTAKKTEEKKEEKKEEEKEEKKEETKSDESTGRGKRARKTTDKASKAEPAAKKAKTATKEKMQEFFFTSSNLHQKEPSTRPPIDDIKKGATYRSLYDTYNATDLVEYCRKHGLMVTGKKKDLIHRILHYLETGEKGAPKRKKKAPKKAKKGASSPKKAKKEEAKATA